MYFRVKFKDGRQCLYTIRVLELLLTDPDVIEIVNADTGEIVK
jgi:hypothetical protein